MGMTISIEIVDPGINEKIFDKIFSYFEKVDETFSVYKKNSEITLINEGKIKQNEYSDDMKEIFLLAEKTKKDTNGYFDIKTPEGKYNPSGLVKGWAIYNASKIILENIFNNFFVDAGGDIQVHGKNSEGKPWIVGIRSPFKPETEMIKVLSLNNNEGVATSGTYIRGQHIYNPHKNEKLEDVLSLTVVGPNVYEADRFATAVFAMGKEGIYFLEKINGLEGYSVDKNGIATMTSGFNKYVQK